MYYVSTRELYHHGILGMKWGIRRFQNKDGSLTALGRKRLGRVSKKSTYDGRGDVKIKKGEILNRVGAAGEVDKGRTYVSKGEHDKWTYIDTALDSRKIKATNKLDLKAIQDINVAGIEAQMDAFVEVIGKYPVDKLIGQEYWEKYFVNDPSKKRHEKAREKDFERIFTKGDLDRAKLLFDWRLENDDEVSQEYFKTLSSKGYQAMIDFNDSDFADLPMIVFDRSKSLKTVSNKKITEKDSEYIFNNSSILLTDEDKASIEAFKKRVEEEEKKKK